MSKLANLVRGGVALALGALLAVSAAPAVARAETVGAFEVTGGAQGTDYTYSGGVLTINSDTELTLSNTDPNTATSDRIVIGNSVHASLILSGVNISAPVDQSAIHVPTGSSLAITLADNSTNIAIGGNGSTGSAAPAIRLPDGATLTIEGTGTLNVTGGSSPGNPGGTGIGGYLYYAGPSPTAESCGTVIILSGTVTVTGGYYSAGIGGATNHAGTGGNGGTVVILSSSVTVTGGSSAVAIGGGNSSGSNRGYDGQGIKPAGDGTYTVYGNLELPCDITIPVGATVTIPSGASLTVPDGTILTNNGTILVQGGSFTGNVKGNQPTYPSKVSVSFSQNGKPVTSVPYGSTVTITATMEKTETATNALSADLGTVNFYLGAVEGGTKLNQAVVSVEQGPDGTCAATFELTLDGDSWKPSDVAKTITVDFGGYVSVSGTGVSLVPNTGSAKLTVVKASQSAPADGVGYSVDYVDEDVTAEDGYELAASADAAEGAGILNVVPGESFYVRVEGSETHEPSDWKQVDVAARPAAPEVDEAFTVAGPDVMGGKGVIAPIDGAQLEYRAGGAGAWAGLPAEGIACTAGERVELRYKAGASTFASEIASVLMPDHTHVGAGAWKGDADGHWRICGSAACGERVDRAPHAFGAWSETVAASCTEAGEEECACTVCGYAETRSVPALGHLWGDWVTEKKPTYDAEGEEVRTCSLCGETESRVLERLTDGAEGDGPSRPAHEAEGDRGDSSGPATGVIPSTGDMGTGAAVLAASAALGTLALGIVCRRRA